LGVPRALHRDGRCAEPHVRALELFWRLSLATGNVNTVVEAFALLSCKVCEFYFRDAYIIRKALAVADKIGDKDLILQLGTVLGSHSRDAYTIRQALAVADKIGDKDLILQLLGKVLGCYSTDDEVVAGSVGLVTEALEGPIGKNYKGFNRKNEQEYRNLRELGQVIIEALKIAEKIEDEQMTRRLLDAIAKFHIYDTILVCKAVVVALRVGNNEIVTQLLKYTPYPATKVIASYGLKRDILDQFAAWESCQDEEHGRITPDLVRRATLLFKGLR
jgi:hypothetical protein